MTLIRTDIHRPSAIQPSEYDYVAFECIPSSGDPLGDAMYQLEERARIRAHMDRTGGTYSNHAHGGNCMVCGNANAIYTVLFHHEPTNVYVRMGQDCASKTEMSYDEGAFNRFRARMNDVRLAIAGKAKAKAKLEDAGASRAWAIWDQPGVPETRYEESTIIDIVSKLVRYGSISEKQMAFIKRLLDKIDDRAGIEARRAAETAAAAPVPMSEDRIIVEGEVLSNKVVETDFGTMHKILIRADAGWKVYGTAPSDIRDAQKGERVSFTARVTKSNDDEKFGFFSRPAKGKFLEDA